MQKHCHQLFWNGHVVNSWEVCAFDVFWISLHNYKQHKLHKTCSCNNLIHIWRPDWSYYHWLFSSPPAGTQTYSYLLTFLIAARSYLPTLCNWLQMWCLSNVYYIYFRLVILSRLQGHASIDTPTCFSELLVSSQQKHYNFTQYGSATPAIIKHKYSTCLTHTVNTNLLQKQRQRWE